MRKIASFLVSMSLAHAVCASDSWMVFGRECQTIEGNVDGLFLLARMKWGDNLRVLAAPKSAPDGSRYFVAIGSNPGGRESQLFITDSFDLCMRFAREMNKPSSR